MDIIPYVLYSSWNQKVILFNQTLLKKPHGRRDGCFPSVHIIYWSVDDAWEGRFLVIQYTRFMLVQEMFNLN